MSWEAPFVEDFMPFLSQAVTPGVRHSCQHLQQGAPIWTEQRVGQVTASSVLAMMRFSGKNRDRALVKQLIQGSNFSTPVTRFGHDNENLAWQLYIFAHQDWHSVATVTTTGLHLDVDHQIYSSQLHLTVWCSVLNVALVWWGSNASTSTGTYSQRRP